MYYTIPKKITVSKKSITLNLLQEGDKIPSHGKEYSGNCKALNQPVEYYDNDGIRKSNETLVSEKLAEDFTGIYYNEKGEAVTIRDINRKPSPNFKKEKPEEWEFWNGKEWAINKELETKGLAKKAAIEGLNTLTIKLNENLNLLNSTDHEIIKEYEKSLSENNQTVKDRIKAREEVLSLRELIKNQKLEIERIGK